MERNPKEGVQRLLGERACFEVVGKGKEARQEAVWN